MSILETARKELLRLRLASLQARTTEGQEVASVIPLLSGPGRTLLPEADASSQPVTTMGLSRGRPLLTFLQSGKTPVRSYVVGLLESLPAKQPAEPQKASLPETPEQQERKRKAEELRRARESMAVEGIGC